MADALAYLSSLTDASCISCAGNTAFQMTSMCHELNQQCEDFYQGVWGHLDDCRHCCQFLSQEPRRASFWQANCQGSSHFAMSTSGAPAGYGSTERLPAQEHSRSAVYGMTQEQQDDVFHRSYRYRMPYHNMKELMIDDKVNYAQHVMTARARHMDASKFREVQRFQRGSEEMRRIAATSGSLALDADKAYRGADEEPNLFPLTDTRFEPSAGHTPIRAPAPQTRGVAELERAALMPRGARPLPGGGGLATWLAPHGASDARNSSSAPPRAALSSRHAEAAPRDARGRANDSSAPAVLAATSNRSNTSSPVRGGGDGGVSSGGGGGGSGDGSRHTMPPRILAVAGARPAAPFIIRPREPAYKSPYPDKDFKSGSEEKLKDKLWPTGLTLIGPQAEWSMGDWGWHVDRHAQETGANTHFTGKGFRGYFNTAYGDDVYALERGILATFFLICLLFHELPASLGSLIGYRSGPLQFGVFLFWMWILVTMLMGAWRYLSHSSDPPYWSDPRQPHIQQGMMVPFSHEGLDFTHKLDLTHRVDEDALPWRGRTNEDVAANHAEEPKKAGGE